MMWMNETLNQRIYDLTRKALHTDDPDEISRIIWEFEDIVQVEGYGLPLQKAFLLWESKKISDDRLSIFLEDCYRWASELDEAKASALRDEVMRWTFRMLWRVTRPVR